MENQVILFYDKCRLCLEKPGKEDIFHIEDLLQDILMCTGVKVQKSDSLPQKICSKCLKIIKNATELRLLATKNDSHLKTLFDDDSRDNDKTLDDDSDSDRLVIAEPPSSPEGSPQKEVQSAKESSRKRHAAIKVRKDLFESQTVTSSTKAPVDSIVNESKQSGPIIKRFKSEYKKDDELRCEICNKVFDKWKKLYLHRRFHNKNIPCPLDGCGKMFATKGDVERHLRIHTGVKPYHCDVCGQSFTQNSTLKSHMKSLHSELTDL